MQNDKASIFAFAVYFAIGYVVYKGITFLMGDDDIATMLMGLYSIAGIFWMEHYENWYDWIFKKRGRHGDGPD